jgi:hypothetical protein
MKTATRPDPLREAVGLPVGDEGEYFVGAGGIYGQEDSSLNHREMCAQLGILNYNNPPRTQPGLWCQWVIDEDESKLQWNGGEKFYDYVQWMHYLIDHFFAPWGYSLSGNITWRGEAFGDVGAIVVRNNAVSTYIGFKGMAEYQTLLEKEAHGRKTEATGDDASKHRTLAFYASKTAFHPGAVAFPTPHGVVMIRVEAGLFPHSEEDAAVVQHLDACQPLKGETVLNTIDLDEKWSTE